MKRFVIGFAGLAVGLWLTAAALGDEKKPAEIEGWGAATDPDGDCSIRAAGGRLTIRVPASQHDLWYGEKDATKRYNAPRVLQQVEGDFVVQVKMTADWKLGPSLPNGRNFTTAGLLVWDSEKQYYRHERNLYVPSAKPGMIHYFLPPVYDRDGKRLTPFKAGQIDPFKGRSTWLRVERAGQKVTATLSHDGKMWTEMGEVTTEFPKSVQVGVMALNGSGREFVVEFEDFMVTKK